MKNRSKRNIYLLIGLVTIFCSIFPAKLSYCDNGKEEVEQTLDWLERINLGVDAGSDIKPRIYFETVQPLYQDFDKQNTFFIQPRYSKQSEDDVYNLGIGYRKLLNGNTVLLGANTFFDYESDYKHYRTGFGLEAFINQIELRSNAYIGLSPRRKVFETSVRREYEKAVDGFDVEAGLPIPHMNWIKVYGAGYWYNYEKFKNKEGWKIRSQLEPLKNTAINLIVWDDNKGDAEFRVDARMGFPWGYFTGRKKEGLWNISFSEEAYPVLTDHSNRTLDRVEREYRIELERWIEVSGAVVEVKRGN